jgi:hypothetical protein
MPNSGQNASICPSNGVMIPKCMHYNQLTDGTNSRVATQFLTLSMPRSRFLTAEMRNSTSSAAKIILYLRHIRHFPHTFITEYGILTEYVRKFWTTYPGGCPFVRGGQLLLQFSSEPKSKDKVFVSAYFQPAISSEVGQYLNKHMKICLF